MTNFYEELRELINRYSQESGSNTPDFILATFMNECLYAFDTAVNAREKWFKRPTPPPDEL